MKYPALCIALLVIAIPSSSMAHHAVAAKFDASKPVALEGTVNMVDWKNPHVHVFLDVRGANGIDRWAVELESRVDLVRSGWNRESLKPGDAIKVQGIAARDGSRQVWANSMVLASTGRKVFDTRATVVPVRTDSRPTPRGPDGHPRLGSPQGATGYWAYPTATSLVEDGVNVAVDANGLLRNIADADKVAPFQRWARDLYEYRQRNFLRDDPMYLYCKPPSAVREFQMPYGVQFLEDKNFGRIFVIEGGGNHAWHFIYTDGRKQTGDLRGNNDNPLYYGN